MSFKEKVKAMKGSEIVLSMINGLKRGHYQVDMDTYGMVNRGVCFGCAATHCITDISGIKMMETPFPYTDWINEVCVDSRVELGFLKSFEQAINELRSGDILGYNYIAKKVGFCTLPDFDRDYELPMLDDNWERNIYYYEEYAEELKRKEELDMK